MRFQVPQFIGVEDKIFGPFTAKQFVYLAGAGGVGYLLYKFLPLFIAIFLMIPVIAIAGALAFVKINGKPFIFIMESGLKYYLGSKLYLWHKTENKPESKTPEEELASIQASDLASKLGESKLGEMTWNIGVDKNMNSPQK